MVVSRNVTTLIFQTVRFRKINPYNILAETKSIANVVLNDSCVDNSSQLSVYSNTSSWRFDPDWSCVIYDVVKPLIAQIDCIQQSQASLQIVALVF